LQQPATTPREEPHTECVQVIALARDARQAAAGNAKLTAKVPVAEEQYDEAPKALEWVEATMVRPGGNRVGQ